MKKITSIIYSNCSNYSSLFFKFFQLRCCFFSFIKTNLQLTVQVCYLFCFLFHGTCFKGKVQSGIFGGFYCFFKWPLKKNVFFLVRSKYMNTEDNYARLIDFLSQISKLSYFNLFDLADFIISWILAEFIMHH